MSANGALASPPVAARSPDFTELGSTGLLRLGSALGEEPLRSLQGRGWLTAIREMQTYPVLGAALLAVELLCRQVRWSTQPDTAGQADDEEAAAFIEEARGDMSFSWEDTLSEILSLLPYGWSYLEVVYKLRQGPQAPDGSRRSSYDDGRIGWRKWSIRPQDTLDGWEFDDAGGVQGMWQRAAPDYRRVLIPIDRALLFRTTSRKGAPEGKSVLRSAYLPWYYATNLIKVEAIGAERDLAGLPVAWVPPQVLDANANAANQALYQRLKELVVHIRRDEEAGVLFPLSYDSAGHKTYDLTLLSSGGARQVDTNALIQRYDQRMAAAVLADFLLLGSGRVGSFALSTDKTDLFTTAITAWLDAIEGVINRHAVPRLLLLNGLPGRCGISHGVVQPPDLAKLGAYIEALTKAGVVLPAEAQTYLLETGGLPVPAESEAEAADSTATGVGSEGAAAGSAALATQEALWAGDRERQERWEAQLEQLRHASEHTGLQAEAISATASRLERVLEERQSAIDEATVPLPPRAVMRRQLERDAEGRLLAIVETNELAWTPPPGPKEAKD